MASRPGVLTEWPWSPLGGFKFLVAPLAIASIHSYVTAEEEEKDLWRLMIVAMMLWRIFTARYGSWTSPLSSSKWTESNLGTTKSSSTRSSCISSTTNSQAARVSLPSHHHVLLFYFILFPSSSYTTGSTDLSTTTSSTLVTILTTTPPSSPSPSRVSVVHPFAEHIAYSVLFAIPIVTASLCGILSIVPFVAYVTYTDFMNYMGHYNFEFFPKRLFHHSLSSSSSATPPRRPTNAASPCTRSRWRERRNHPTSSTSLTSLHSTPSTKCALASRPSHLVPCGLDPHGTSPTSCGPSLPSSLSSP
ncbi:unnamed protein product [Arabidopsis thaliana]|uniref:Uncharacterized protein n=1 Tax=Arabidopsis thaliana TaxID=3702 RepID=A0A5S9Y8Z8_ARATH|nr:unnamed protein product [Arabidopsis thaliana]